MLPLGNALTGDFYARHTPDVARDLIGATLYRKLPDGTFLSGKIVETEAYREDDPACHAARGPTPRCKILFGPPGLAYVYFIYGNYHCLNVVTEPEGVGCAVLIRGVEGDNTNGPGKLCREWIITRDHNGVNFTDPSSELLICKGDPVNPQDIGVSSRIGISAAQHLQWRYFLKGHPSVSRPKPYNRPQRKAPAR